MNKEILAKNERIKKYWLKMNEYRNTDWKWMNKEILAENEWIKQYWLNMNE